MYLFTSVYHEIKVRILHVLNAKLLETERDVSLRIQSEGGHAVLHFLRISTLADTSSPAIPCLVGPVFTALLVQF
jgi:hypothetical protein